MVPSNTDPCMNIMIQALIHIVCVLIVYFYALKLFFFGVYINYIVCLVFISSIL